MIHIQKSSRRGTTRTDWLESRHSFSFGQYHEEEYMHFGPLRVLNDDVLEGGGGFPMHPHRDMEILTYVVRGTLEHRDSTGGHGLIRPGELQRMSAGTGITHSEYNHSETERLRLLQIWIFPDTLGLEPGYEQRAFTRDQRLNRFLPVAVSAPAYGELKIHQDAQMYISALENGKRLTASLRGDRGFYLFLIEGAITVGAQELHSGDAAMVEDEEFVTINANAQSELLCFELPLSGFEPQV